MNRRFKNLLSLLLAVLMTLTMLPLTADAETAAEGRAEAQGRFAYVNPFYRRTHTDEELETELAAAKAAAQPVRATPHYTTFAAAAAYVRDQMVARNTSFSLSVPDTMTAPINYYFTDALVEEAMTHVEGGSPKAGDSLRWQLAWCYCSSDTTSGGKRTLQYTGAYYTTAAQESTLTAEVNSAMSSLNLSGKTESQKIRAIYDFICDRVDYDYDHLEDNNYNLQYTAYAAMHLRTAVCQGYAVLFYRMCMEAGLDVRVVTSYDHAWNIVRMGSVYYNVDATWDGGDETTYHDYYLKGMRDFPDHYRESPYCDEDFEKAYPMVRDPNLNTANPLTTLPGVDGGSVSAKASGKPKLLIFGELDDNDVINVMRTMADCSLTGLDVVYADCGDATADEVSSALADDSAAGVKLCWNSDNLCLNALFDALEACTDNAGGVYVPVIFYIDSSNRIQHYTLGHITDYSLLRYIEDYLGVTLTPGAPRVTGHPEDTVVRVGEGAFFDAWGRGSGTLNYQWYRRAGSAGTWEKCADFPTGPYFYEENCQASMDGWQYRCRIYNDYGSVYTQIATLHVCDYISVLTEPKNISAPIGETAKFKVEATGGSLLYQWQYKTATGTSWYNCTMKGHDGPALYVPVTAARNGYQYRCRVSNLLGDEFVTNPGTLKVKTKITVQPASVSAPLADIAKFTVKATGVGLTYQWQYRTASGTAWNNCSTAGNATATLSVPVNAGRNGYKYRCLITDANGNKTYTNNVTLTVKTVITSQPADAAAPLGNSARFTVKATGAGLQYQWQYKNATGTSWYNSSASGSGTDSLSVTSTAARNGQQYRCVITDINGKKTYSKAATLTVKTTITAQPKSVTASVGETVKFTVKATGVGLTYQWQYKSPGGTSWINSTATGSDTTALSVKATAARNGQQYRCVITDANGKKTYSDAVTLTVR